MAAEPAADKNHPVHHGGRGQRQVVRQRDFPPFPATCFKFSRRGERKFFERSTLALLADCACPGLRYFGPSGLNGYESKTKKSCLSPLCPLAFGVSML
jgi:hypothetical protein